MFSKQKLKISVLENSSLLHSILIVINLKIYGDFYNEFVNYIGPKLELESQEEEYEVERRELDVYRERDADVS